MSDDVGADDSAVSSTSTDAAPERPAEAPDTGAVVLVVPEPAGAPAGPLARSNAFFDGDRAMKAYLRSQLSPRSRQNAADALRRLARLMLRTLDADPAQIPWPAIGFEQATTIRAALYEMTSAGAITPGTANLTLSHLRGLIRTMYAMRLVTADQHELVHSGALKSIRGTRQSRGRALSPSEERALREAARGLGGYQGAMLDTAIVLAVGGALRREEVARLTVEGLSPGFLQVVGKGNKEKRMPVDAQMQTVIDAWLEERARLDPSHGGLFVSPQRPDWTLSAWSFWSLVRNASHRAFGDLNPCAKECRCFKIVTGPHDFRRTFATRFLEQHGDIRELQVLMGHASPETTARYDKRAEEELFKKRRNTKIIA
jgi:integrase